MDDDQILGPHGYDQMVLSSLVAEHDRARGFDPQMPGGDGVTFGILAALPGQGLPTAQVVPIERASISTTLSACSITA